MSYAIKVARRGQQGDPGLFGFLGGVVKGITKVASFVPGPLGTIAGAANTMFAGGRAISRPLTMPGGPGGLIIPGGAPPISFPGPAAPGTGLVPMGIPMGGGGGGGGGGNGCKAGYRLNKSGYWSNKNKLLPGASWTEPGSTCVKRRRMNPLNPRAISRAIRRIESAKRATARLSRVTVRGGCGCK